MMGVMFLLSVGQVASSLLVPIGMERLSSSEWEDIAGEYPSEGNEREQDEWREGEVFWNESMDYWESIIESGIFEVSAVFSMVLILLSAASIPVLWNGDRDLGLKLVSGWLFGFMSSQIITTLMTPSKKRSLAPFEKQVSTQYMRRQKKWSRSTRC